MRCSWIIIIIVPQKLQLLEDQPLQDEQNILIRLLFWQKCYDTPAQSALEVLQTAAAATCAWK